MRAVNDGALRAVSWEDNTTTITTMASQTPIAPTLEALDSTLGYSFVLPVRRINDGDDLGTSRSSLPARPIPISWPSSSSSTLLCYLAGSRTKEQAQDQPRGEN